MPILEMHVLEGVSPEQKQKITTALTNALVESMGARMEQCIILFHDVAPQNYANAGVTAATRIAQGKPATVY